MPLDDPKPMMEGAMRGVAKAMFPVVESMANRHLTERQQLARFNMLHRGNPASTAEFVAQNIEPGQNPLDAMAQYEAAMMKLHQKYGGQ